MNKGMNRRALILAGLLLLGRLVGVAWAGSQDDDPAASQENVGASEERRTAPVDDEAKVPDSARSNAKRGAQAPQDANVEAGGSTAATTQEGALVSVDFKDADIRQVLRILSLKSGVDIVAGSDVEGLVTIKLTNVPWEQALDIILRTYGFTYERSRNIVRVMTIQALEQEALATEVFPLNYATAKDVPDIVKEMLSERGRVKFDERTNTVIVTDIPASLFQIKRVVDRLDQRTPQVLIETKVVETRLSKDEQLGIDWSDSLSLTATAVSLPTTFPFPGGHDLGNFGSSFIPRAGTFSPSNGAALTKGRVPETGGQVTFGTLSSSGFQMVLHFLQSRTDTHILSNPSISALNNQEARVHIGSEFPIPNYSVDPTTGRTTITGYTAKNIGTVLTVTPHVNPNREIVVDLRPEVIAFSGNRTYDTGTGNSVSLPEFTTQTAQTQVRIGDRETVAIGGLVKENNTKTQVKVPVLGDIPVIGLLFKNTTRYSSSDPVRQDLLIFLTVKLMGEVAEGQQVATVSAETSKQE